MKLIKTLVIFFALATDGFAFVVLIDPGHGGKELGAVSNIKLRNSKGKTYSKKIFEKDLTLVLAKKIKERIDKKFSTYLTRSFDRTVTLEQRAALADTVKADLFISIHFNSSREHKSHGFETYYLDNHQDKAIKKVEAIENKGLEGDNKTINQILIDLVIQKTVPSSKKLANSIHVNLVRNLGKKYKLRDRGIKPGLFYVLALSKRPGVLIECGFLSNPNEIKKLNSNKYQDQFAKSIADGIEKYYSRLPKKELPIF